MQKLKKVKYTEIVYHYTLSNANTSLSDHKYITKNF